jgi:hypothetical protein
LGEGAPRAPLRPGKMRNMENRNSPSLNSTVDNNTEIGPKYRRIVVNFGKRGSLMEDSPLYCKYCGSEDLRRVNYKGKDNSSDKITVDVKLIGIDHGTAETQEVSYSTFFCNTCRKINCETPEAPKLLARDSINNIGFIIVLPYALDDTLRTIEASVQDVANLIRNLGKTFEKSLKYFNKYGENPCNDGKIGFERNVKIKNQQLHIRIIMNKEPVNGNNQIYARIIYDGGRSICQ